MKSKVLAALSIISAICAAILAVNGGDYFVPAILAIVAFCNIE